MLAKGTPLWIISIPLLSGISALLFIPLGSVYFLILASVILIAFIPVAMFFRDPQRHIADGVVSPADGKVTRIEVARGVVFISIFMNVHNVHVNRSPWRGRVLSVEHIDGGFVPAFDKDSDSNERVIIMLRTEYGDWEIVQIAGAVARRIIPYIRPGDKLEKGERFGMIRFGSRVDLTFKLPKGHRISVDVGQKVKAGSTDLSR